MAGQEWRTAEGDFGPAPLRTELGFGLTSRSDRPMVSEKPTLGDQDGEGNCSLTPPASPDTDDRVPLISSASSSGCLSLAPGRDMPQVCRHGIPVARVAALR
jgi:hypothetical protein